MEYPLKTIDIKIVYKYGLYIYDHVDNTSSIIYANKTIKAVDILPRGQ